MKFFCVQMGAFKNKSHPVRGAWIEIYIRKLPWKIRDVAPREGCVD